jgi:hypothetical protein
MTRVAGQVANGCWQHLVADRVGIRGRHQLLDLEALMTQYLAPSLTLHGDVIVGTCGLAATCSVDAIVTAGSRACTGTHNDAPHVENTVEISETSDEGG